MIDMDTTSGELPPVRARQGTRRRTRGIRGVGIGLPGFGASPAQPGAGWLCHTLSAIDRAEGGARPARVSEPARPTLPARSAPTRSMPVRSMPAPTAAGATPHDIYLDHLKRGELAYQYSPATGRAVSLPLGLLPLYSDEALEWRIASGLGTVYTSTVVAQRGGGGEYSVSLIDCDEGFRVMSRVEGMEAHRVRMGQRVRFQLHASPDDPTDVYPVFVPV